MGKSKRTRADSPSREQRIQKARARLKNTIRGTFRRIWSRFAIERKETLDAASHVTNLTTKAGKVSKKYLVHYECAKCHKKFARDAVQVDHIKPIGAAPDFMRDMLGWATWLAALFCEQENLQVLCVNCHKLKTKADKVKIRK